jgi:hypothetical protein
MPKIEFTLKDSVVRKPAGPRPPAPELERAAAPDRQPSPTRAPRKRGAPRAPSTAKADTARPRARVADQAPAGRPVQTSITLAPAVWQQLDELAPARTGELLNALLREHAPADLAAAVRLIEQLLAQPDEHGQLGEERNLRIPRELRLRLDELSAGLTTVGGRGVRSQLIEAIARLHAPESPQAAQELLASSRIRALRSVLAASDDAPRADSN